LETLTKVIQAPTQNKVDLLIDFIQQSRKIWNIMSLDDFKKLLELFKMERGFKVQEINNKDFEKLF
jgi:hypothetical protein